MDICDIDDTFGPVATGCRGNVDFTIFFEQSVLSIGPSAIFLLLALCKVASLLRSPIITVPNILSSGQIVSPSFKASRWLMVSQCAALAFTGLQLGLLIEWARYPVTPASIPAATLSFVDSVAILALACASSRNIRPISVLTLYLFFSMLFGIVELRTLYLRHEQTAATILGLSTAGFVVRCVLLLFQLPGKAKWLRAPHHNYGPEATSGLINRSLFWWLNPLIVTGFRKILTLDDLYSIDPSLDAEMLGRQMQQAWIQCMYSFEPKKMH